MVKQWVEWGWGRGREATGGQGKEPRGPKTELEAVEGKRGTVACKQGGVLWAGDRGQGKGKEKGSKAQQEGHGDSGQQLQLAGARWQRIRNCREMTRDKQREQRASQDFLLLGAAREREEEASGGS